MVFQKFNWLSFQNVIFLYYNSHKPQIFLKKFNSTVSMIPIFILSLKLSLEMFNQGEEPYILFIIKIHQPLLKFNHLFNQIVSLNLFKIQ